jgi:predicted nucleic acid-binding protein
VSDNPAPIVVDATVLTKWYVPELYSEECRRLLDLKAEFFVPEAAISQVSGALWKRARTGELRPDLANRIVRSLCRLPVTYVPTSSLGPAAMELAIASGRTFNESLYFALALRKGTRLVTADHRWFTLLSTGKLKSHIELVVDTLKKHEPDPA